MSPWKKCLQRADQQVEQRTSAAISRGAMYVLYLDQAASSTAAPVADNPEKPGMIAWLTGEVDPGASWLQRYSNFLCAGGLLLLLLGAVYQFREDWDYWASVLARVPSRSTK